MKFVTYTKVFKINCNQSIHDMLNSFHDLDNRYHQLSKHGKRPKVLFAVFDSEMFRLIISHMGTKSRKSIAVRKLLDRVIMFKVLILQHLHNLAYERLEFQIKGRFSFSHFLGLELSGNASFARTVWAFREEVKVRRLLGALFDVFNVKLFGSDVFMNSGQIVDVTYVAEPAQRNDRGENKQIKQALAEANEQDNTPRGGYEQNVREKAKFKARAIVEYAVWSHATLLGSMLNCHQIITLNRIGEMGVILYDLKEYKTP